MAGEQPKKPVGGAYGVFLAEKRPEYAKATAGQKASAISKIAGEAWGKLSDKDKAPYQKKYEELKTKFDKDMEAFLAAGGEKQKGIRAQRSERKAEKEGGGKRKKKDRNAPKRPAGGAYGVYLAENREKIVKSLPAGHKITDVSKKAGEQWKALSDAAKQPYEEKYKKKQEEYKAAMEEYKKNGGGEAEDGEEAEEAEEEEDEEPPKKKSAKAAVAGGA